MTDTFDIDRAYAAAFAVIRAYYDERADPIVRDVARGICIAHLDDPDELVCSTVLQVYDAVGRNLAPHWQELVPRWTQRTNDARVAINVIQNSQNKEGSA